MNTVLIKIFAAALAFSQAATRPDAIKTTFDPERDQAEVTRLLTDGCAYMRKAFDIEDVNLDDLIATAMDDKDAIGAEVKALKGLSITDLHTAYRQFCKRERIDNSPVDIKAVIEFFNEAVKDLPDAAKLKGMKLPGMSMVFDNRGEKFAEVFAPDNRRVYVPLAQIPEHVRNAFVAAEDKRFFQHHGIDERGLVRAFVGNLAQPGRPQGGSTITQQVAKNLLVGNDLTYERKLREIIVAARVERALSKNEILELYLNSIYLGRGAWGIEVAAQAYFGKPAKSLTVAEGALLAGLAKGPSYFNPDRNAERARERFRYVLSRMQDDGMTGTPDAKSDLPQLVAFAPPRRDVGFHYVDRVVREAKSIAGIDALSASSYTVRSTINPALQRAVEVTLQEGLARYELNTGRAKFEGPELSLADSVAKIAADATASAAGPPWLAALRTARMPLYDVHWEPAIVVENTHDRKRGDVISVGLADGRIMPLNTYSSAIRRKLNLYDVVYVRVREPKVVAVAPQPGMRPEKQTTAQQSRADLRIRPTVQGAAVVLENGTGRILAMSGGFSYPASQLNRAEQAQRQPGSTFKPLTYLAGLHKGLQPNTLVLDQPITLPPIGANAGGNVYVRERDYWSPRNFEGGAWGAITLRYALENSRNLATANLMARGLADSAEQGLDSVCDLAMEAQLYKECSRYYPFVLGAQPLRLIDLAAFYAAIASEGARPAPYAIETIEQGGRAVYRHDANSVSWIGSADRASFFQLKSMLQGVLERGTARAVRHLAPYAGGKTGTTQNETDAWFVGFTNDITVALWVGYDNADGRRTLGHGQTGAKVALPMFEPILQAAWEVHAPKTALNGPSPEAMRELVAVTVDPSTGDQRSAGEGRGITEYFKRDTAGGIDDTQFRIVSRAESYGARGGYDENGSLFSRWTFDNRSGARDDDRPFFALPWRQAPRDYSRDYPYARGNQDDLERRQPRRVDPDYFFNRQRPW